MLKNEIADNIDLVSEKTKALGYFPAELLKYLEPDNEITEIEYPVILYPSKVNSLGFDKQPEVTGKLTGIKGQYLIFEDGSVLNIRKHNGYYVTLQYA